MAGSLGEAQLQLSVDNKQFQAGLSAAIGQAEKAGAQIQKAISARQAKVDSNNQLVTRLQKEAITADASRASLIRQRIALIQNENREQQAGISSLRAKLAAQQSLLNEQRKAAAEAKKQAAVQRASVIGIGDSLVALGTGAAVTGLFKAAINEAVQLETITRRLSNTLGKEGAGAALSFTRGLADQLGLSFKDLASAFASFTAAASGAGVPLEQQKELFAAVSKAGQALGLSSYEISGSLLALQQVASKGTVQMEELRGQLGERLPIAFAAAAKGLGLTQQELIKLVESGQLAASRFFPGLTRGLNEMTSGAGGAETAAQSFQKLQNSWDELMVSFGQSLLPTVIDQVKTLSAVVEGLGRKLESDQLGFGTGLLGFLGVLSDKAIEATETLKIIGQQAGLSSKEVRALWYDALKLEGIKNPALANEQQLSRVIAKTRELAAARSKGNVDINKEAAEAQRLLGISAARAEAEQKILRPARERLRSAQALATLDGPARSAAEAQLAIDVARAKYAEARAKADSASGQQGNEAGAAKLKAAAEAAAADLKTAMLQAGDAMKDAAKSAADQLKGASNSLKGSLRSNLDLLSGDLRKKVIGDAFASVRQSAATGRYDLEAISSQIKTNQDVLDMASKLESLDASFDAYDRAQETVARTQEQLGASFTDLGEKLDQTAKEMASLAKKDWNVYVNGQRVSGYGEMVGAMNRGL